MLNAFWGIPPGATSGPGTAKNRHLCAPSARCEVFPKSTSKRKPQATSAKAITLKAPGCLCFPTTPTRGASRALKQTQRRDGYRLRQRLPT